MFAVLCHAAGEFLEGVAYISPERFQDAVQFLRLFQIGEIRFETAKQYAYIVSGLRKKSQLTGLSKPDLWIAAWALEHGSPLVTKNLKHFKYVPELKILEY